MEMEQRKNSGDASSAIAAKLLQGWALLNDYCPQCINPLLRNREGRIYCVGCSQFVIRESDAPAPVLEYPVERSQSPKDAATLNEPAVQNGYMDNAHENLSDSTPFQQVDLPSNMNAVLSQTLCTLVQKIEEMSKLIAVTHDPLVIKQLLGIIEHCLQVMQQITTFSSR